MTNKRKLNKAGTGVLPKALKELKQEFSEMQNLRLGDYPIIKGAYFIELDSCPETGTPIGVKVEMTLTSVEGLGTEHLPVNENIFTEKGTVKTAIRNAVKQQVEKAIINVTELHKESDNLYCKELCQDQNGMVLLLKVKLTGGVKPSDEPNELQADLPVVKIVELS